MGVLGLEITHTDWLDQLSEATLKVEALRMEKFDEFAAEAALDVPRSHFRGWEMELSCCRAQLQASKVSPFTAYRQLQTLAKRSDRHLPTNSYTVNAS